MRTARFSHGQGRDMLARVEDLHPGFKVVAGPFNVETPGSEEQGACRRAFLDQRRARCEAKVVKVNGLAYVLRNAEGWQENDGVGAGVKTLTFHGYQCPLCGRAGFLTRRALSVHRCPKLPTFVMSGRVYHQRLETTQVELALEQGRAKS